MPTDEGGHAFGPTPERSAHPPVPSTTWREYFYRTFLRVWVLCFFFVGDVWLVAEWLFPWRSINLVLIVIALSIASYLEFLAYEYLWYEPGDASRSTREPFRRGWMRPVPWGRWSEAWADRRSHRPDDGAVDPSEFL
jgi:hypothetical protein